MLRLFGTSGIRGNAQNFFTNQVSFDLGRTFSQFLKKYQQAGTIAVGMDTRTSSPRIKNAFTSGLVFEKEKVVDEGIVPVPAMNWILINGGAIASAMITGSHVAADLNGIKFFAFEEEILKKHEHEIEEIYSTLKDKVSFKGGQELIPTETQAINTYVEMLINHGKVPYPNWKIVVDTANGGQAQTIFKVLEKLGLEVVKVNDRIDGNFIARDTETEGVLDELGQIVIREKADFGIGFDGDGDRVVFVDSNGIFIPGDYIGTIIAKYDPTPAIVTPINTSQVIESIGKKIVRTKVGSPYVVEKMKEIKSSFGFEANGGCFFADIMMSRDGGSTLITVLNLLKEKNKTLRDLINELPQLSLQRRKIDCPSEKNEVILNLARQKFNSFKTEELDGLKVWVDDYSWVLFRPSQNAPEFRVFAEAENSEKAVQLLEEGIKLVKSV